MSKKELTSKSLDWQTIYIIQTMQHFESSESSYQKRDRLGFDKGFRQNSLKSQKANVSTVLNRITN